MIRDILRICRFTPYRKGMGPAFTLRLWDTHRTDDDGKWCLGYALSMAGGVVLFQGEDFYCPKWQAADSDATVRALMTFLTLRPGDTDAEYFADYTPEQLSYCDHHAEALSAYVLCRFAGER